MHVHVQAHVDTRSGREIDDGEIDDGEIDDGEIDEPQSCCRMTDASPAQDQWPTLMADASQRNPAQHPYILKTKK